MDTKKLTGWLMEFCIMFILYYLLSVTWIAVHQLDGVLNMFNIKMLQTWRVMLMKASPNTRATLNLLSFLVIAKYMPGLIKLLQKKGKE